MITLKPPFQADDMQGLFKKVLKGNYQRIPGHYTKELAKLVRAML
jgi:NIMA (never in mitosis gene a)-related kinase